MVKVRLSLQEVMQCPYTFSKQMCVAKYNPTHNNEPIFQLDYEKIAI